jgi:hypothetical protein
MGVGEMTQVNRYVRVAQAFLPVLTFNRGARTHACRVHTHVNACTCLCYFSAASFLPVLTFVSNFLYCAGEVARAP